MSKIDEKTLSKLESLARLQLTSDERAKISKDLTSIIDMFDRLNEVDTDGVEPLRHINRDIINRLREDRIAGELSQDQALANVDSKKGGYIAVPKFLKPKS
jgi:aspartyl-tRNA(Asn)/glutamyl-tRNA(Gln) amidotransferase subunit C